MFARIKRFDKSIAIESILGRKSSAKEEVVNGRIECGDFALHVVDMLVPPSS
jgi:hypothetical protein